MTNIAFEVHKLQIFQPRIQTVKYFANISSNKDAGNECFREISRLQANKDNKLNMKTSVQIFLPRHCTTYLKVILVFFYYDFEQFFIYIYLLKDKSFLILIILSVKQMDYTLGYTTIRQITNLKCYVTYLIYFPTI